MNSNAEGPSIMKQYEVKLDVFNTIKVIHISIATHIETIAKGTIGTTVSKLMK